MKLRQPQTAGRTLSRIRAVEPGRFGKNLRGGAEFIPLRMASTFGRSGASEQTGSVAEASARKEQRLAAAAAKVQLAAVATEARFLHPFSPAGISWKCRGVLPDFAQTAILDIFEGKPGMTCAAVAGSASPRGVMSMSLRPQPPMQGLGYFA